MTHQPSSPACKQEVPVELPARPLPDTAVTTKVKFDPWIIDHRPVYYDSTANEHFDKLEAIILEERRQRAVLEAELHETQMGFARLAAHIGELTIQLSSERSLREKMTVFLALDDESGVSGVFTNRDAARETFPDHEIDEREAYGEALPVYTYWNRGAAVYPDGTYDEWTQVHNARGEVRIPACDDHLNAGGVWDGHTQSHCGEHISIFGTDESLVEARFRTHLSNAIARQNGTCQSRFAAHSRADGIHSYETGFMNPPRAANSAASNAHRKPAPEPEERQQ